MPFIRFVLLNYFPSLYTRPGKCLFISHFKKLHLDRHQETFPCFTSSEQDGKRKEMKGGKDHSLLHYLSFSFQTKQKTNLNKSVFKFPLVLQGKGGFLFFTGAMTTGSCKESQLLTVFFMISSPFLGMGKTTESEQPHRSLHITKATKTVSISTHKIFLKPGRVP